MQLFGIPQSILESRYIDVDYDESPIENDGVKYVDLSGNDVIVVESTHEVDDVNGEEMINKFHALSYNELRKLCKCMGVESKGNKGALMERVMNAQLNVELPAEFCHLKDWYM